MAKGPLQIETIKHDAAKRLNIPTAEYESVMRDEDRSPVQVAYQRRNRDLDPQLVWRGKDEQDWSDLVVSAPPLYIQEKVHPKVLIDDLKRETKELRKEDIGATVDLFADFNGLPDKEAATEFYQHDQHWSNRMISGDSLAVMASLTEREGLRGKVQCIYFDPPYGIKFNSNFQWSTRNTTVTDGKTDHVSREPEQIRAFRDTWKDGIHSYLTYLRDRLTVSRDLLSERGSIFLQIGTENVHLVRSLMDEIFGVDQFCAQINFAKTSSQTSKLPSEVSDYILWYCKSIADVKIRTIYREKDKIDLLKTTYNYFIDNHKLNPIRKSDETNIMQHPSRYEIVNLDNFTSQTGGLSSQFEVLCHNIKAKPKKGRGWRTGIEGVERLKRADRLFAKGDNIFYRQNFSDFPITPLNTRWEDTQMGGFLRGEERTYVVQTAARVIARCILMSTDPGDLVLDPTCGSGTTAYVAEQYGRRWITIDTSRVSLALTRSRLMGARYPYYILADSREGQLKEAEINQEVPKTVSTTRDIRQGFVYERVSHITLRDISNNTHIDLIYDEFSKILEPLRFELNNLTGQNWEEWNFPHEVLPNWSSDVIRLHKLWWESRVARQTKIDSIIRKSADFVYLYDKPFIDNSRVRVAGPFTVESLSPHRTFAVGANDELIDTLEASEGKRVASERDAKVHDFAQMILENLKAAGVQQAHKDSRITFTGSRA